jgi:hypothetical protein
MLAGARECYGRPKKTSKMEKAAKIVWTAFLDE